MTAACASLPVNPPGERRKTVDILSILMHLRANLHSGAEYGWAMPPCVRTAVVDCYFCLEILFVVVKIRHARLPAHNTSVNWRE